jgi:hypothetical protein
MAVSSKAVRKYWQEGTQKPSTIKIPLLAEAKLNAKLLRQKELSIEEVPVPKQCATTLGAQALESLL